MADIVNLRRFRKNQARARAETTAKLNRAVFGRSKAEREQAKAGQAQATLRLDGHRLAASEEEGGTAADS